MYKFKKNLEIWKTEWKFYNWPEKVLSRKILQNSENKENIKIARYVDIITNLIKSLQITESLFLLQVNIRFLTVRGYL